MFLKVNHNRIKALIYSLSLATLLAACVNSNNTGGSSQQYLTVSSQKTAVLGLQSLITDENSTLRDVANGNGIYVVVGDNGAIIRSNDGINWQPQNGVVSENLSGITYNTVNKLFYAVGDAGLIISSPDGVNWTEYKRLTPAVKLNSIMSVKGDEIIAGESGNVFEVAVTSKRGMVVVQGLDDGSNSTSTAFNGDETMLIGTANGDLYYKAYSSSFSTANWSRTKTFTNMPISDISYNALNSSITATTLNGYVTKSTDGKTWSVATSIDPLNTSINLNSITVEPWTNRYLVVGGDSQQNELVRFSSDFNQWAKGSLSANYQLQKVRCFDENSCVAVGDNETLVVASKKVDLSGMDWKLIDLTKPSVKLAAPLNGAINTSTKPIIKLDFNKYVNNVNSATISLREGSTSGTNIPIGQITASGNDFVFSPSVKLKESTKYIIVISNGIADDHENKIPASTFSFTTGDFTAPTLVMTNPKNAAINISTKPTIQMNFSEDVQGVNANNLTLRIGSKSGTKIAIGQITQGANNSYTFTPTAALNEKAKYFVVASNGITDLEDNKLVESSFSFTTGDFTAPSISISTPSNNATNVPIKPMIQINFSEEVQSVNESNLTLREGSKSGAKVTIGQITQGENNSYTFTPAVALKENTTYFVTASNGITDLQNNKLVTSSFSFTTGDLTVPSVSIISPSNNATNIPTNPLIHVNFSEIVQNVNTSNLTLRVGSQSGSTIAISQITQGANNRYTFTPTVALKEKTTYFVVASNGITDLQGNKLVTSSFSFTTGDFTAPSVSIISPSNNATNVLTSAAVKIKFSESVVNVNKNTVVIRAKSTSGNVIAINDIVAQSDNTYTIIPADGAMTTDTRYYVTFAADIKDLSNNQLVNSQFSFTTVPAVVQKITFSPITNAVFGSEFNLAINMTIAEPVEVTLQAPMYNFTPPFSYKFTCDSGLTCAAVIKTNRYGSPGSYLIQAVGLNSGVAAVNTVQISSPESLNYIAMADPSSNQYQLCYIDGSLNVNGCKANDSGRASYGVVISPGGTLFSLLQGGIFSCSLLGDGSVNFCSSLGNGMDSSMKYNALGAAFSVNSKYFYSTHYSTELKSFRLYMCGVADDSFDATPNKVLSDCAIIPGLPSTATDLALNYNGDRLLANTADGVAACIVDKATGTIKSCVNNTSGGKSMSYLAFSPDNKHIYTVKDKSITECDYNYTTNKLSACVTTSYSMTIGGLAFSQGKAILGNQLTGKLSKCSIATDGTIGTCSEITGTLSSFTSMSGLAAFK